MKLPSPQIVPETQTQKSKVHLLLDSKIITELYFVVRNCFMLFAYVYVLWPNKYLSIASMFQTYNYQPFLVNSSFFSVNYHTKALNIFKYYQDKFSVFRLLPASSHQNS